MKVVRSSVALVVQVRPGIIEYILGLTVFLPLWIFLAEGDITREQLIPAVVGSLIAAGALAFIIEITDFKFSAISYQLHWRRRTVFRTEEGVVPLADISEVSVAWRRDLEEGYRLHVVQLTVPSGVLSVTRYIATGGGHHVMVARAIVEFLAELGFYPRYDGLEPEENVWRRRRPRSRR